MIGLGHLHPLPAERPYLPLGLLALCIAAAACHALSSVLQQREARRAPTHMAMRPGLIGHLLRRPVWLSGNLAGLAGFALQFLALRRGSLAVVQPLLVIGLVFALAGAAALDHRHLSRRDASWTALTMVGLALFLVVARPRPGASRESDLGWLGLALVTAVIVAGLVALARARPSSRALSLGAAAGVLGGVLAALIKRTGHGVSQGLTHTLLTWPLYALGLCGILGIMVTQSAYQAGDIRLSLPALTTIEPVAAILIGELLFSERVSLNGLAPAAEVLGLALMSLGVFGLGDSASKLLAAPAPPVR